MFKKAVRSQVKFKGAVTGPSGSGKTYSSLKIAVGLGGKIAVICTENGSAALYSDKFNFDMITITPPYHTEKYQDAIAAAVKFGYDVLVVDSISHAWSGEGGLLAQKEQLDARGGNSYTNWAKITPKHEAFLSSILHSDIHLVATMRSKQDYVLADKNGKQVPQKVGMAPTQREGVEYEFTTVFDIAMNHEAAVSKDRTGLFDGSFFKITEDTGEKIKTWLSSAAPTVNVEKPKAAVEAKAAADDWQKAEFDIKPPAVDAGKYTPTFGKFKGKQLDTLDPKELRGYCEFLVGKAEKASQPIRGTVKEMIEMADEHLKSHEPLL